MLCNHEQQCREPARIFSSNVGDVDLSRRLHQTYSLVHDEDAILNQRCYYTIFDNLHRHLFSSPENVKGMKVVHNNKESHVTLLCEASRRAEYVELDRSLTSNSKHTIILDHSPRDTVYLFLLGEEIVRMGIIGTKDDLGWIFSNDWIQVLEVSYRRPFASVSGLWTFIPKDSACLGTLLASVNLFMISRNCQKYASTRLPLEQGACPSAERLALICVHKERRQNNK